VIVSEVEKEVENEVEISVEVEKEGENQKDITVDVAEINVEVVSKIPEVVEEVEKEVEVEEEVVVEVDKEVVVEEVKEVEIKENDINILSDNWDNYNLLDECNLLDSPEIVRTEIIEVRATFPTEEIESMSPIKHTSPSIQLINEDQSNIVIFPIEISTEPNFSTTPLNPTTLSPLDKNIPLTPVPTLAAPPVVIQARYTCIIFIHIFIF
jgi:hypothetical protein